MATKKTTKKATTTKATKSKKAEPTLNSFAAALNAPFKTSRSKAETEAAQNRAEAKSREIDERLANAKPNADAKPKATKKGKADAKPKKLSAIDAAAKLLGETGEAMTCKAMVEAMTTKGLWTSPAGKTPHATLYSAILREITTKGKDARFKKTDRGHFAAV